MATSIHLSWWLERPSWTSVQGCFAKPRWPYFWAPPAAPELSKQQASLLYSESTRLCRMAGQLNQYGEREGGKVVSPHCPGLALLNAPPQSPRRLWCPPPAPQQVFDCHKKGQGWRQRDGLPWMRGVGGGAACKASQHWAAKRTFCYYARHSQELRLPCPRALTKCAAKKRRNPNPCHPHS